MSKIRAWIWWWFRLDRQDRLYIKAHYTGETILMCYINRDLIPTPEFQITSKDLVKDTWSPHPFLMNGLFGKRR